MTTMRHDLWFALRRIRARPIPAMVVVLTLGLGIGAALAVFALVDAVLLRPLPYSDAQRLVRITQVLPTDGFPELGFSGVGYRRLISDARALEAVAAYTERDANLLGRDATRRLVVAQVTASLFDVLQVRTTLGRPFSTGEDIPNGARVLVLSDHLWRSAFDADLAVVGTVAVLEGEPFTIVGVLPPSVAYPSRDVAAWEPLRVDPAAVDPYNLRYSIIGRLREGITLEQAQRDITAPIRAVGREYPGPHPGSALDPAGYGARVRPLADVLVGDVRPVVLLLLAGALLLLLLTCANVANLQLAGALRRGEELAVRAALGASRARLVRGAFLEGLVLAAVGAALGFVVATIGHKLITTLLPAGIAPDGAFLGGRAVTTAAVGVLAIGAMVGALPVAALAWRAPAGGLRDRNAGANPVLATRVRRFLAAAQVALAVLLMYNAGLLVVSARAVQHISLGFRPDSTATLSINVPAATLSDRAAREALLRRLVDDAARLPGVVAAGLVNALPLTPGRRDLAMAVEGRPFRADGTDPLADYRVVSAGYFAAMRIPLARGRLFTDHDASATYTPIVVSRALARRLFPDGADPIGRRLRFGPAAPWMPIVGMVEDARNRSITEEPRPELYTPGLGTWSPLAFRSELSIVVRGEGDPATLAASIERLVRQAAPDVATYAVRPMNDVVRDARSRMTTATQLMSGYALAALLLAVAGTYAVLSFLVTQRRRELAVRIALGASPRTVASLIGRESGLLVALGLLAGLAGSATTARLLSGMLYSVDTVDVRVALLVIIAAGIAGSAASALPARRAIRTDPASVLRSSD